MLHPDTIPFLNELSANNNREWFADNKPRWEAVKKSFTDYTEAVILGLQAIDPAIGTPRASRCLYRIYRDVRFSSDKRPYKAHVSFFIPTGGQARTGIPGYYVQFDPEGGSFMGGGIFMPEPQAVQAIRQEIFYCVEDYLQIVEDKEFTHWFGTEMWDFAPLKTAPKGYDKTWPHIRHINHRNWCCMHEVPLELANRADLVDYTLDCFRAALPLNTFLRRAMYELIS